MANGPTHRLAAAAIVGMACVHAERHHKCSTFKPVAGAALAAFLTNLPDILEPALHPNHRQFFHSLLFAALVMRGAHCVYEWEPQTDREEITRFILLVGAGAYLVHLALDAVTAKSLPLIGRL